jgi:hypothetical protein
MHACIIDCDVPDPQHVVMAHIEMSVLRYIIPTRPSCQVLKSARTIHLWVF